MHSLKNYLLNAHNIINVTAGTGDVAWKKPLSPLLHGLCSNGEVWKFPNVIACPRKMESDHSLSVLILILFLFSRKLVVCASFKCHQVSVTHFLSLMYCKSFWHLFHSLLHGVFQILFWLGYSFVPLGFITLSWRVCLWVRASSVCGTFALPA